MGQCNFLHLWHQKLYRAFRFGTLWPISCSYPRHSQLTRHSLMLANGRIRQSLTALVLNYVLIVTFWISIYHEIWILLNIFLYGTIELFILWHVWRYSGVLWVNSCPPLSRPHQAVRYEWALLHHWLCNQKHPWGICSCSPIVNFLKVTFYHGMVILVIFLIKKII